MGEVGHWSSTTEMEKLTQTVKISGIIEQDIKKGGLLYDPYSTHAMLPVAQWSGLQIEWNRETDVTDAENVDPDGRLEWSADDTEDTETTSLRAIYKQTLLNGFRESVHGNINNYKQIQAIRLTKSCVRKAEKDIIYGDNTYTSSIMIDGLHAIAAAEHCPTAGTADGILDIDGGQTYVSLGNMRTIERNMLYGIDIWLMPPIIAQSFDAMTQEQQIKAGYQWSLNQFGQKMEYWSGIPIVRSDYLVGEQADTGRGSNARALYSSGTAQYSIFALKFGQVTERQPGVGLGFGGENRSIGQIFEAVNFQKENLPDYHGTGLRIIGFMGLAAGSEYAVGRIHDVIPGQITA